MPGVGCLGEETVGKNVVSPAPAESAIAPVDTEKRKRRNATSMPMGLSIVSRSLYEQTKSYFIHLTSNLKIYTNQILVYIV